MLTEPQKVEFPDNCNKMRSLSSTQLQELIKSFDSKFNHQRATDVSQIKSGTPAKMKLRDAREVLEIARLKVWVSEMKEKTVKLEAQLLAAAKQHSNSDTKSKEGDEKTKDAKNLNNKDLQDGEKINEDLIVRQAHNMSSDDKRGMDSMCTASQADDKCKSRDGNMQDDMYHNRDLQSMKKITKGLEEQDSQLDKDAGKLHVQINSLQHDIDEMVSQLPEKSSLQKELAAAKDKVKTLQEEIKDDAGATKSQLLLLKQQFGELEERDAANKCKELEFQKASQLSSALEAEVEELQKGNKELLETKQKLSKSLLKALKKAEKIKPVTEDDVLVLQAEVSGLRSTNAELQKKVENLQMSRFNEVEEVVYLRWVNACLCHDLDIYKASRRNPEGISEQSRESVPSSYGKDDQCDLASCTNSGRSFPSYSDVCEDLASQNDGEERTMSCESSTKSSPQRTILHGNVNIRNLSPLDHLNSSHASPPGNIHDHANSGYASRLSITHGHVHRSRISPLPIKYGNEKSTPTTPQMPHQGMPKTRSGPLLTAQQLSPSNSYLSQSPEPCNPSRHSTARVVIERDPQRLQDIQSRPSFNNRSATSVTASRMTASTSNSPRPSRRSGFSFNKSIGNFFLSSEASINRPQSSPQKQDIKRFIRSFSALSSESSTSISNRSMPAIPSRQHSAPSGADPPKCKEHNNVKAHSFDSSLGDTDRVVAAFQMLDASTHKNAHRTFKDLSRQNSCEDEIGDPMIGKHPLWEGAQVDSNSNGMSRGSQQSQISSFHGFRAKSTQADFFCDLARAIQDAQYRSIQKVAAFVNWFDRQGEVEKQEFFNFSDCPKDKLEAMRRVVYEYEELQAMEHNLNSYKDDREIPADLALEDMKNLLEKVENHIQGFKQARELAIAQFMELGLPTAWMLDSEMILKIKRASLKLAQKYIQRVLKAVQGPETEMGKLSRNDMLLQAARFLLQIHNFAGGFDEDTASAFRMLQTQAMQ